MKPHQCEGVCQREGACQCKEVCQCERVCPYRVYETVCQCEEVCQSEGVFLRLDCRQRLGCIVYELEVGIDWRVESKKTQALVLLHAVHVHIRTCTLYT